MKNEQTPQFTSRTKKTIPISCWKEFENNEGQKICIDMLRIERFSKIAGNDNIKMTSFVYKSGNKETLSIPYDDVFKTLKELHISLE